MGKWKNKGGVGCFGVSILLLAIVLTVTLQRGIISAVSPDGKLTAQVTQPSLFDPLFGSDEILLELVDNATGKRIVAQKEDSGGILGDVVNPVALIWHHDSQRFAYISEISPALGWPRINAYRVQLSPLKVHEADELWLKSTIALNLKSQDKAIKEQAEKLSKYLQRHTMMPQQTITSNRFHSAPIAQTRQV